MAVAYEELSFKCCQISGMGMHFCNVYTVLQLLQVAQVVKVAKLVKVAKVAN